MTPQQILDEIAATAHNYIEVARLMSLESTKMIAETKALALISLHKDLTLKHNEDEAKATDKLLDSIIEIARPRYDADGKLIAA